MRKHHPDNERIKHRYRIFLSEAKRYSELKAWSQNLGHDDVLTTFTSYGTVAAHRQAEIMTDLRDASEPSTVP